MANFVKVLLLTSIIIIMVGCKKDANRKLLNATFTYSVNGKVVTIKNGTLLNENLFECKLFGDTALQVMVGKVFDGAGFFIKDKAGIQNKTYILNASNKGIYQNPSDFKRYTTTNTFTGSLTIKRGTFMAKDLLNTLEGTFEFNGADTLTGKNFKVKNGSFLMELSLK